MTTQEIVTTDLAEFGYREKKLAGELLQAMCSKGLPEGFDDSGVTIALNRNSGFVFLTNSEYQVAMMNNGKLESFYTCPQCGHEGFKDEMKHKGNAECRRYQKEIGAI